MKSALNTSVQNCGRCPSQKISQDKAIKVSNERKTIFIYQWLVYKNPKWSVKNNNLISIIAGKKGLPQWLSSKEFACSAGTAGKVGSLPGWEDPLQEGMATHSSIFA